MSTIATTPGSPGAAPRGPAANEVTPDIQPAHAMPPLDAAAVKDQLVDTREEITRVDGKASILLAGAGVAVGVVVAGLIAGDLQITKLALVVVVLGGLAAAATLVGIGLVGAAIYPRCGKAEHGRARYFTEVAVYDTPDELRLALANDAHVGDRVFHQLLGLSKAVATKYALLGWGIRFLGLAIMLATGAGVIDLLLA